MRKIKVKLCNLDEKNDFSYGCFILNILRQYYDIEISENPDYIFYNESTFDYLNYPNAVRIFITGENIHPNFNLCDYAVSFDYNDFGDRAFRLPVYLVTNFYRKDERQNVGMRDFTTINYSPQPPFTQTDLDKKSGFCSFVYSNYMSDNTRKIFFEELCNYKKVNSGGAYLNNIGERIMNKLDFESKHKFSIAFENSSRSGYTTEKLPTALIANTIPIYWGNPDIGKEFNEKRFINCHAYKNFSEVIERIKEIDNNNELYLQIINQPKETKYDYRKVRGYFEEFLQHIIDQPLEGAYRRHINPGRAAEIEKNERLIAASHARKSFVRRILASFYRPFKNIRAIDDLRKKVLAQSFSKNNSAPKNK